MKTRFTRFQYPLASGTWLVWRMKLAASLSPERWKARSERWGRSAS